MQDPAFELPRIHLLKLSERGRRSLRCSLTEHRNGTFRPIFASQHVQIRGQSIARTPFRTVSEEEFSEVSPGYLLQDALGPVSATDALSAGHTSCRATAPPRCKG